MRSAYRLKAANIFSRFAVLSYESVLFQGSTEDSVRKLYVPPPVKSKPNLRQGAANSTRGVVPLTVSI